MTFNENLRKLRKDKDFSQEYLAERMQVSRQTISKWESGTAMPDLKKLTELAELFDVSMDYLLGTKIDTPDGSSNPTDYTKYINDIVSATISAQQEAMQKKSKTTLRIIVAILAMLFLVDVLLFILSISIYSFRVETQPNYNISTSSDTDYDEATEGDYVETELISINEQNPNMLTYNFCYTPTKYSTNTKVFFSTEDTAKTKKYPTTEKNGKYTAKMIIDLTSNDSYYLNIQQGDTVERYPVDSYFIDDLISYISIPNISTKRGIINTKYKFTYHSFEVSTHNSLEIESASLVTDSADRYTQDLSFTQSNDEDKLWYNITLDDFSLSNKYDLGPIEFDIKIVFTNGIVARITPIDYSMELSFPNGESVRL